MKILLKATACLLISGFVFLNSCKNEDEMREEANASVVNVEKGVAPAVWTTETEGAKPDKKKEKQEEPIPEPMPEAEAMPPQQEYAQAPAQEQLRESKPAKETKTSANPAERTAPPAVETDE